MARREHKPKELDRHGRPVDKPAGRVRRVDRLSEGHAQAVEFYLRGMTKQEALIKAGYSPATAAKAAWKIFGRPDVQMAIEERRWKMRHRSHEMVDRIQEELARIAFFNIGQVLMVTDDGELVFDFNEATMEDFAAIGEVQVESYYDAGQEQVVKRVKVKPLDKKGALDSLARIFGMFQDNMNVTSEGGSLEDRLNKGRERLRQRTQGATMDGEYEEVQTGEVRE